jgi:hypothetical protein
VELGVYKGNSASLLAAFARRENRHVFLYDTLAVFTNATSKVSTAIVVYCLQTLRLLGFRGSQEPRTSCMFRDSFRSP